MPRIWLCVIVRAGRVLVMIMAKIRRPVQRADKCGQVPGICMLSAARIAARLQPGEALSPMQYPQAVSAAQSTYLRMQPRSPDVQALTTHSGLPWL